MIDRDTWAKGWALLESGEKRTAWMTLGVVIAGAFSSMVMVGSILPFLAVLSDPGRIEAVPVLAWVYDSFGFETAHGFLIALGVGTFAMVALSSLMQIIKTYAVVHFAQMQGHSIGLRLLASYLHQPYAFFLDRHSGDMSTRLLFETTQVVGRFYKPAADLIAALLTTVMITGLLLWANWVATVAAFSVLGGAYLGIYALIRRNLRRLGEVRLGANSTRFRLTGEAFGGIKELKVNGREGSYVARFEVPSLRMARAMIRVEVLSSVPKYLLQTLVLGGIVALCLALIAPQGAASGRDLATTLPLLGLFAFAGQRLMPELSRIYGALAHLQAGAQAVTAIHDDLVVIAPAPDTAASDGTAGQLAIRQGITLKDITFHYPYAAHPGLKGITLEIRAGEKMAVVGSTGAGKTTLADIILGLLEPAQGQLLIDGVPVTACNHASWQKSVGYVPQDIFLTDSSVAENIALGVPPEQIDQGRVAEAARTARIDEFIRADLPQGYDTHIGERGLRLSGGQRQRIGIARALYHDPSLIVFDEATSALDTLTETEVMEAVDALPGDKTVLLIAHRPSTVRHCDRIVLLDKGRVAGIGTWDELNAATPLFHALAYDPNVTASA